MKRIIILVTLFITSMLTFANVNDSITYDIDEVTVVDFYNSGFTTNETITKDYLNKKNICQEPSYILAEQPSIMAYSDTGNEFGYAYFRIRGIDQSRINMTLDGMPLNEGEDLGVYFSNIPNMIGSLQSINVQRGATSLQNGTSGYGGSINFESVNLSSPKYANININGGSFGTYSASAEFNSGRFHEYGFYGKVTHKQTDGYRDYASNNSQSAFIKFGYNITPYHSIDILSFNGLSRNGQGWIGNTQNELKTNKRSNGCVESEDDRFIQSINKITYKGLLSDNITLSSSLFYNFLDGWYDFDVDNFNYRMLGEKTNTSEVLRYKLKHHMIGGNIAMKWYINDFTLTSGVNGSSFNRSHTGLTNLTEDNILYSNKGYKNDINVFVKTEYENNVIHLLGNIQYRHADFDYKGDVPFEKINWDFINYNLGATFKVNSSLNIYTTFAHTNREPTRTDMFGGEDNFIGLITKQHETVDDVEFGVKYFTKKFKINANLFYMDFANELIFNGEMGKNGIMLKNNVNTSRRMGIEVSATYQPLTWLSLTNASSLSKNQIIDDNGEVYNHTMTPNFMMRQSIDVDYDKFACGFVICYRDKMNVDLLETFVLNESIRCNAYVSYSFKYCTIKGEVNNIFNTTTFSNGMKSYTGENLYFIDAPFNFNIGVNVNI